MIDHLTLQHKGPQVGKLLKRMKRLFTITVTRETKDEVDNISRAEIGPLKLTVYGSTKLIASLSLHQFRSYIEGKGKINYDRFSYSEQLEVINLLECILEIPAEELEIHSFEYGQNHLSPSYPIESIVEGLLLHGNRPFVEWESGIGQMVKRSQYLLKVYNKQAQAGAAIPILRIESRVMRMKCIEHTGIATLADLRDPNKLQVLHSWFETQVSEIMLYDPSINIEKLGKRDREYWREFEHLKYWRKYLPSKGRVYPKSLYKQFQYRRDIFKGIVNQYSERPLLNILIDEIGRLFSKEMNLGENYRFPATALMRFLGEIYRVEGNNMEALLGDSYSHFPEPVKQFLGENYGLEELEPEKRNLGASYLIDEREITPNSANPPPPIPNDQAGHNPAPPRRCLVCNADISHRSPKAKYCDRGRKCRDKVSNAKKRKAKANPYGPGKMFVGISSEQTPYHCLYQT